MRLAALTPTSVKGTESQHSIAQDEKTLVAERNASILTSSERRVSAVHPAPRGRGRTNGIASNFGRFLDQVMVLTKPEGSAVVGGSLIGFNEIKD